MDDEDGDEEGCRVVLRGVAVDTARDQQGDRRRGQEQRGHAVGPRQDAAAFGRPPLVQHVFAQLQQADGDVRGDGQTSACRRGVPGLAATVFMSRSMLRS
ncbi:hypothetical protein [Streptomyces coeruleorubidus]|uniref:hypothetical protein n=1 Tax=Streptomyces coeruleorubidus TaxID=116188 RepID=UPI0033B659B7